MDADAIPIEDDNKKEKKVAPLKGWICPVCGAGVSIFESVCPNCRPVNPRQKIDVWTCGS